jgi:hypothetical protein
MRLNRKLLYIGVFLVAMGSVLLLATGGIVDEDTVIRLLQLWPIAVIAVGAGLLLRRTRLALAGGLMAAAIPGLLLGGVAYAAPAVAPSCSDWHPVTLESREGTFQGGASVDLHLSCGNATVSTAPGDAWQLQAGNSAGDGPAVSSSPTRLSVTSATTHRGFLFGHGRDAWQLTLPGGPRLDLNAVIEAGRGQLDMSGAHLGDVQVAVRAGDAHVDLAQAFSGPVSLTADAAAGSLILPAGQDTTATVTVNAGSVAVCTAPGVGVRIHQQVVAGAVNRAGLIASGDGFESPDYAVAAHHADVTVKVSVGSVDINPEGGCK